jgi:four helix bundle protein
MINSDSNNNNEYIAGFEKLWIWQKANELLIEIQKIIKNLPYDERYRIKDQIDRSSTSVTANIAEGHTSYYYQDKIKALTVARKEAGETQNHIRTLQSKDLLNKEKADNIIIRYEEVIRGINGYINWVRKKKGAKK